MRQKEKSLEYWKGVVDAIIEKLCYEEIYIEEEKEFECCVMPCVNCWSLNIEWVKGFKSPRNTGTWDYQGDDPIPVKDENELYFSYDESISKVIKEITLQLEEIESKGSPKDVDLDDEIDFEDDDE